jgi:predicted tellurium resistance membrane protein TerC
MIEINGEWIIGVVFGVGVLYALCQIFMSLGKQHDWRGVTIDFGILLYIGVLLVVALVYVVGTNYLSKELTSSVPMARVFWVFLMILPTAVYALMANKSKTPGREKNNQKVNTGKKKKETDWRD